MKHFSPKGQRHLNEAVLTHFQRHVRSKEDFLTMKRDEGGQMSEEICQSDIKFLKRIRIAVTQNTGDFRKSCIKGAMAAWLNLTFKKKAEDDSQLNGMRYEKNFKNYCLAAHILSAKNAAFERANLCAGAAPHPRNLNKLIRDKVLTHGSNYNMDPVALRDRIRPFVKLLADKGVKAVSLGADELVALQAVCYDPRYKRCVGATGKYANMTYEEVLASDITVSAMARTVKFWGIIPQSNDPLFVIAIRPGGAKGDLHMGTH